MRALAVGGLTAVMFMDFYKPYASVVLLDLPPVLVHLVRLLATLEGRSTREIGVPAAVIGAILGCCSSRTQDGSAGPDRGHAAGLTAAAPGSLLVTPARHSTRAGLTAATG